MTLGRVTIATSDFTPLPFYSYDDLADPNATDNNLTHFSVERDEKYVLPAISQGPSPRRAARVQTACGCLRHHGRPPRR